MFAENQNNTPIINISYDYLKITQYDTIKIPYVVYVANNPNVSLEIYDNDELQSSITVPRNVKQEYSYQVFEYIDLEDDEEEKLANIRTLKFKSEMLKKI